jgi:predicted transcriptional regulator of viral defense system
MAATQRARLLRLAARRGVVDAGEAHRAGIHSQQLTRLVAEGRLERLSRGRYRLAGREVTEHHGLVVVARAVPHAVVSLLSAATFHGLSTQLPHEVWITIDQRARRPSLAWPRLRVTRASGAALTEGVEEHRVEGEVVRVYGVAKTVADLFKHRNKVGLEVALEALREAWKQRRFNMEQLDRCARICRVERVMRPYVEALVG